MTLTLFSSLKPNLKTVAESLVSLIEGSTALKRAKPQYMIMHLIDNSLYAEYREDNLKNLKKTLQYSARKRVEKSIKKRRTYTLQPIVKKTN